MLFTALQMRDLASECFKINIVVNNIITINVTFTCYPVEMYMYIMSTDPGNLIYEYHNVQNLCNQNIYESLEIL